MHNKIGQDREQLFTTCLDEYVESDNSVRELERLIIEITKELDTKPLRGQSRVGCRSYSATELLCLLLYGYINGITSSRQLEKATRINMEVRWLLKSNHPSYRTIADFRKDNGQLIEQVFYRLVQKLAESEYITGKLVVLDGTKTKANAKRDMHSASTLRKQIAKLEQDVQNYMQKLDTEDKKEAELETVSRTEPPITDTEATESGSSSTSEGLEKQLQTAQAKLQDKQAILNEMDAAKLNYMSPTDKDSILVCTRRGKVAGYNPQYMVDGANHMIVDVVLTSDTNDKKQLYSSISHLVEHTGITPECILADKGYTNLEEIKKVHDQITRQIYVSLQRSTRDVEGMQFNYDADRNVYICPQGRLMTMYKKHINVKGAYADFYKCESCQGCPIREKCVKSKDSDRRYSRYENQEFIDAYKEKMKTAEICTLMEKRKTIIEHVFGTIATSMHFNGYRLRSKAKVRIETYIHAIAYNLKRLFSIPKSPPNQPALGKFSVLQENSAQSRDTGFIFDSFTIIKAIESYLCRIVILVSNNEANNIVWVF